VSLGPNIRRAIVATSRALKLQAVQVREGGASSAAVYEAEHFEPFGFTARPMAGAEAIVGDIDGTASHSVILAVSDRRYRPTDLLAGESAQYDAFGHAVECRTAGIVVKASSVKLGGSSATAGVARAGDTVEVTIPAGAIVINVISGAAVMNPLPITLNGTITGASSTVKSL
jgi:phage baseplate assembly protein V